MKMTVELEDLRVTGEELQFKLAQLNLAHDEEIMAARKGDNANDMNSVDSAFNNEITDVKDAHVRFSCFFSFLFFFFLVVVL
jgi:hypothetical protein